MKKIVYLTIIALWPVLSVIGLGGCGVSQEEFNMLQKRVDQLYDKAEKLDDTTDDTVRKAVESAESRLSTSLDEVRRRQADLQSTLKSVKTNFSNLVKAGVAGRGASGNDLDKLRQDIDQINQRLDRMEKVITGKGQGGGQ